MVLVVAAGLWMVGCGQSSTETGATTSAPQTQTFSPSPGNEGGQVSGEGATVNLVDAGFARTDEGGTPMVSYGVVLENTSTSDDALDVDVSLNFLDDSGTIVQSEGDTIHVIPAGDTYYLSGGSFPAKGDKTTKLEVQVAVGESAAASYVLPEISDLRMTESDWGEFYVRGVVTNPYSEAIPDNAAGVHVVCFDASGRVVGGGYTFIENGLQPGAKAAFDASLFYGLKKLDVKSVKATMGNGALLQ